MSHRDHFGLSGSGVDESRLVLEQIRNALELPKIYQRTTLGLILRLGERTLGWKAKGQELLRPAPALDLSPPGTTIKLIGRRMSQRRSYLEHSPDQIPGWHSAFDRFELFSIDGAIGAPPDDADGEVTFLIPAENLDVVGRYLFEPRVTFPDGSQAVSRHLKINILASLAL